MYELVVDALLIVSLIIWQRQFNTIQESRKSNEVAVRYRDVVNYFIVAEIFLEFFIGKTLEWSKNSPMSNGCGDVVTKSTRQLNLRNFNSLVLYFV